MLGIRFHQEAAEVRNMLIDLLRALLPPTSHLRIEGISGLKPPAWIGAAKLMLR